jgi:hypothetical protein
VHQPTCDAHKGLHRTKKKAEVKGQTTERPECHGSQCLKQAPTSWSSGEAHVLALGTGSLTESLFVPDPQASGIVGSETRELGESQSGLERAIATKIHLC